MEFGRGYFVDLLYCTTVDCAIFLTLSQVNEHYGMLSARRAICNTCRSDLLNLFQRGFCGPAVLRSALRFNRRRSQWQQSSRSFHASRVATLDERPQRPPQRDLNDPTERFLSDDELRAQFEALDALEEYSAEDDKEDIDDNQDTAEETQPTDSEGLTVDLMPNNAAALARAELLQQLQELRDEGADAAEIAERARELFGDRLPLEALQSDEAGIYTRLYGEPLLPNIEPEVDVATLLDKQGDEIDYDLDKSRIGLSEEDNQALLDWQDDVDSSNITGGFESGLDRDAEDGYTLDRAEEDEEPTERRHPFTTLGNFQTNPKTLTMPREQYLEPFDNVMTGFNNAHLREVCEKSFGGPGLPDSPLTPRSGRSRPQVAVQLQASQYYMGEQMANAFVTTVMPPAFAAISAALVDARKRLGASWLNTLLAKEGGPRVLDAGAGGAAIMAWDEIVRAHWSTLHTSEEEPNPVPTSKAVVLAGSDPLRHRSASLLSNTTFVPRLPDYATIRSKPTLDDDRPAQARKEFDVVFSTYSLLPFKEEWERKQYIQNLWSLLSPSGGVLILIEKGMPRGFEAIAAAREQLLERFIATPPGQETRYTAIHRSNESDGAPWQPETGMIIGPCSNHEPCPMYKIQGKSIGRKDICSFQQRYIRPPYLQRVIGASARNHDDVDFSYISVMKGQDLRRSEFSEWSHITDPLSAPSKSVDQQNNTPQSNSKAFLDLCGAGFEEVRPNADHADVGDIDDDTIDTNIHADAANPPTYPPTHLLPRLIFSPIKRRNHVILDLCTPLGTIERWTVPRSFSRTAYRDARKASWGDLWALGAKTRIPRNLRQGSGQTKLTAILDGHMKGKPGSREEKLHNAEMKMRQALAEGRREEEEENREMERRYEAGYQRSEGRKSSAKPASKRSAELERDDAPVATQRNTSSKYSDDNNDDQDELDYEIEQKLLAWEADLTDKRPLDRQGKPMRIKKPRRRDVEEDAREVPWSGFAPVDDDADSDATDVIKRPQKPKRAGKGSALRTTAPGGSGRVRPGRR